VGIGKSQDYTFLSFLGYYGIASRKQGIGRKGTAYFFSVFVGKHGSRIIGVKINAIGTQGNFGLGVNRKKHPGIFKIDGKIHLGFIGFQGPVPVQFPFGFQNQSILRKAAQGKVFISLRYTISHIDIAYRFINGRGTDGSQMGSHAGR
jgi:hypothetical protein